MVSTENCKPLENPEQKTRGSVEPNLCAASRSEARAQNMPERHGIREAGFYFSILAHQSNS